LFSVLATSGLWTLLVGSMPAMAAADLSGCRGDQTCVKIAQTTGCDAGCQRQCKELRFDVAACYTTWGPKFEFWRSQHSADKRGTK
jgi:hypothetical protein